MEANLICKAARTARFTFFMLLLVPVFSLRAQVTGTRTIGVDYPTLASAINALNTLGVSGPVTVNVPAGFGETAPAGGYLLGSNILNASLSASSTLTIQKSGSGANPLFTAPVGTSTSVDGIFFLRGVDYVTINGIDLAESSANTTATTRMEWGYALVKLQNTAPFDGCQNVTIQNCTVTLNRLNTPTVGIYAGNHIATATTALTLTAAADAMNNCKFYSNTIQNSVTGISLRGFAAASPYTLYDQNNDVGGATTATGNTIQNYAGATSGSAVNLQYQNNANVSNNTINNVSGAGVASTVTLYGVYVQNGTNASVNVNNNSITLVQGTTTSASYDIYIGCSGTGTVNANGNRLSANGGSGGSMYMIYFGSANTTVNTNSNVFYDINVATTATLAFIYHNTATSPEYITCNNNRTDGPTVPFVNKTGAGGSLYGYYNNSGSSSGSATLNGNNFSSIVMAGSPTFYGLNETNGGSGQVKTMYGNVITKITSAGGGSLYALRIGYAASENVSNNTIGTINAGTGTAYGVYVVNGTTDTIANNNVSNLSGANVYGVYVSGGTTNYVYNDTVSALLATGASGQANGIYQSGGTTVNVYQNRLYDIAATGSGASSRGIYLSSGTTNVYNNLVGDIRTPTYSGTAGNQLSGIYINGGTAHNLYYNSVYLNAASTGTDFGSSAIYSSTTPAVTLRNNIFVNLSAPAGGGNTVAYRRSSTALGTYQSISDNNLFYAGTPGAARLIYHDGTDPYMTIGDFKSLVAPRDISSVTENPPFLSTVGTSASFLHINAAVPTQVESGAVNISGITTDYDNNIRAGNPGYAGAGSAPDIGADEGNFVPTDLAAPGIAYTVLPDACLTGDRTFTANITDESGVPTTGALVPRVYFRKNSGPWFSQAGTLASGTATSGTWSFTISSTAMGGLAVADTISYFVIAQDVAPAANIGSNPSSGLVATNVNTITTYPTAPNAYVVLPTLSGIYNVGVGMAYATITDAVNAYNTSCISGAVVFQLMDATYPSETFPIVINNNVAASASNTLTIRPAAGVSPTITGSAAAIFRLNGADYVTIEGSNAPVTNSVCPWVVSPRSMTISNTSTSTTSAVIWLQTAADGDSATNNIIRNCNIAGNGPTQTLAGIGSGSATISNTSTGTGNHNNRFENDSIIRVQIGIYSAGRSATQKNQGTVINQNVMTTSAPDNISRYGILTGFENNITISGNRIGHVLYTGTGDVSAISVGIGFGNLGSTVTTGNEVTNATITYNNIDSFIANNAWSNAGIALVGAASGSTLIANNMISRVLSRGTGGDFSAGIFVGGVAGSVTNVYYNTVNISGTLTGASYPSFAMAVSGTNPVVNINNNIFVNTSSNGSSYSPYAIGLAYGTYTNLNSNNNSFYSSGPALAATTTLAGGGALATLADWQSTTGDDAASVNVNPSFVAADDMHLALVVANAPLNNTGVPVSVTTDYDCEARSSTPDIGADEFAIPPCSGAVAGTVTPATAVFCGTGTTTITATGFSTTLGTTYSWQSSNDSATWTAISGATSTSYTIEPAITDTTYYRFVVRCSFSGVADSATTTVIVNPLPVIAVTPDGGGYCSGSGGSVTMTASGAATYSWSPGSGLSGTTGPTVTASPSSTTAYTVTGTDGAGCAGTHVSTVTVTSTPPPVVVTPLADTACVGVGIMLSGSSSMPDTAFLESFNAGIGLWTVTNTGTSSAAVTQWTSRPDGYVYAATTYHSPDASPFIMTNSDAGGSGFTTISSITSPSFSLAGYTAATLRFNHYYRYIASDVFVRVEISTDGGSTWSTVRDYRPAAATVGSAASFVTATLDLSAYAGSANCKLRFNYSAGYGWYWAVDNVVVTGVGSYSNITWSPASGLYNDAALTTPYVAGTSATTIYAAPATAGTFVYTATATNGACTSTGTASITALPLPTAFAVTGGGAYCSGGAGSAIGLSGSELGVDYQLYNGATAVGVPVAGTGSAISFGLQTAAGTYSVSAINATTTCAAAMTGTVAITISPLPVAYDVTGGGSLCAGATGVGIGLSGSDAGVTYQLYNGATTVGSPIAGTGAVLDFGPQTAAGTYSVLATAASSCTQSMTGTAVVVVNPLPTAFILTGGGSFCAGDTGVHIGLTSSQAGVNYQLYFGASAVGSTVAGTGSAIDFGLQTAAGTYSVLATNATTACTAPMTGTTTVSVNPLPVVHTVTGGGNYCAGTGGLHIGLSGSETGNTYRVYQGGVPVGLPLAGTGAALDFGAFTTAGVYSVVATSPAGCNNTMAGSAVIVVSPAPLAFTVTGGGSLCAGATGVSIGLSGSQTGITYQLYNGAAAVGMPMSGTGTALDFGPQTTSGTYSVLATNTTTSCTSGMMGSATVVVNPLPVAYTVTGGGSYCAGSAGSIVGLSSSEVGINYELYVGAASTGITVPGTGAAISFGPQTTPGVYTVAGINPATGCVADMTGAVTISVTPAPAAYSVTGGGAYCAGGTGVAIGLSGSDAGTTYQLYNGAAAVGGPVAGTGSAISFGLQTAAGTYSVLATSGATACTAPMTGSAIVFINPTVPPSVSITSSGGDTICAGSPVTFTAVPVNGGFSPTYQWSVNGVNTGTGVTFTYVPVNGDIVRVHITSSPCAMPDTASSATTVIVTSGLTPSVSINASPGVTVCYGYSVTLTAMPVNGGTSPSFLWTKNGINVATGPSYSYVPVTGDVVTVKLYSSHPCRLIDSVVSAPVTITVSPVVTPSVTIVAHPGLTIAPGQSDTLVTFVSNAGSTPTYQWSINGVAIPGATNATFIRNTFVNGDVVTVQVTSSGLCSGLVASASVTISVGVGVDQVTNKSIDLRLSPNPNKGVFFVAGSVGTVPDGEAFIQVTDMLGQVVYESKVNVRAGKVDERIELSNNLANGTYLLRFGMGVEQAQFHFILTR